ncbi:MAG: hypothetical protein U1F35_19205 [Steroidobacteraceae bacterium]
MIGAFASSAFASAVAPGCSRPAAPVPEKERKFHPGHYVTFGNAKGENVFSDALAPGVAGIEMRYRWAELEPREGQYDLSLVARDLDLVRRSDRQLVVLIEDKTFKDEMPTPAYLAKYTLPNRNRGYSALRWDPYVNGRLEKLVEQIGAQFDCDPHFEGVAFQETAPGLEDSDLDAHGYSAEAYRDALIDLLRSASASVPRSRVFWYMNFLPRGQQYIGDVAEAVLGRGVVMGGPDILPDNPVLAQKVYPFYEKFRGRMPLFNSMQHNSYRHRHRDSGGRRGDYWSMEDLYGFARDRLHVDYVFWDYHNRRQPSDSHDFGDAREVIMRHPTINSGNPH